MSLVIKNAKIKKDGPPVVITFDSVDIKGKPETDQKTLKDAVHPDLLQAFQDMAIHLAIRCGYVNPSSVLDIEFPEDHLTKGFFVTAFSLGKDDEGIVITGHKIIETGEAVILNTPYTRYEVEEGTPYIFIEDLLDRIDKVKQELRYYMSGVKRGSDIKETKKDDNQGSLVFDEPEVATNLQIVPPIEGGSVYANPEAMQRLKQDDEAAAAVAEQQDAIQPEQTEKVEKPVSKPRKNNIKKVPQTAENPSGIKHVPEGDNFPF